MLSLSQVGVTAIWKAGQGLISWACSPRPSHLLCLGSLCVFVWLFVYANILLHSICLRLVMINTLPAQACLNNSPWDSVWNCSSSGVARADFSLLERKACALQFTGARALWPLQAYRGIRRHRINANPQGTCVQRSHNAVLPGIVLLQSQILKTVN